MITILSSPNNIKIMNDTKLPTPEQILSSIIYCRKYNIPFNDNYTEDKLNNITSKTILNDMYGLQEPILHKFKTPFQTYIVNKIILNPKLKSTKKNQNNSYSVLKTLKTSNSSKSHHTKHTKSILSKSNTFFNDLFKSSSTQSKNKTKSSSTQSKNKNKTKSSSTQSKTKSKTKSRSKSRTNINEKSLFKIKNLSLDKSLFNSNNSLVQAGLMIDSRKDFTKENPNEEYDNFKSQFRYYRSKGRNKEPNLNIIVQNILGDNSISQAWLKMYEIISECNIVPLNKIGTFKSFHYCEAPGTFINCLNNYVYTKSRFNKFEWMAQSLHPRLAKIKDAYGIIKRHPKNW